MSTIGGIDVVVADDEGIIEGSGLKLAIYQQELERTNLPELYYVGQTTSPFTESSPATQAQVDDANGSLITMRVGMLRGIATRANAAGEGVVANYAGGYGIIVDGAGVAATQRAIVKFTGSTITDNGTETIVAIAGGNGTESLYAGNGIDIIDGVISVEPADSTILVDDDGVAVNSSLFAASGHNHDSLYSPIAHNHSGVYSPVGHNHDGTYSPVGHDHDSAYASKASEHAQNTDTGTTSTTFQLDSNNSGVKIKNSSGVLEARDSADSAYAIVRGATPSGDNDLATKAYVTALIGAIAVSLCGFRLTLTSGTPITTADVTGASTIYFTPHTSNQIATYDSSVWTMHSSAEISLALSSLTSGKNYDVFVYNNSGTLTLELSSAWTNDTTRADALAQQDGVWVKSADHSRRYVGTIRTTDTTTTEDSEVKRFVYNHENKAHRKLKYVSPTQSWTQTAANSYRQANANSAYQVEAVLGMAWDMVDVTCRGLGRNTSGTAGNDVVVGIGIDSTTTNSADLYGQGANSSVYQQTPMAIYKGAPGLGYHKFVWLEHCYADSTWYGSASDVSLPVIRAGLLGEIGA